MHDLNTTAAVPSLAAPLLTADSSVVAFANANAAAAAAAAGANVAASAATAAALASAPSYMAPAAAAALSDYIPSSALNTTAAVRSHSRRTQVCNARPSLSSFPPLPPPHPPDVILNTSIHRAPCCPLPL